ncbi:hypothetical protein LTR86_006656 [Recurvomyces mirabilis]|nr:hypothetical protein LTR86_006656 [Recurvomyces mirabilis]
MEHMGVTSADDANYTSWSDGYPSYFRYESYGGWMVAHIALMISTWFITMPMALMLSIARSRFHLPAQLLFHALNGVGVLTGFVYNHATPNLYKGDTHSPGGWVVTSITIFWTFLCLYTAYSEHKSKQNGGHRLSSQNMGRYRMLQNYSDQTPTTPVRWSGDSGMGSSRHDSSDSLRQKSEDPAQLARNDEQGDHEDDEEPEHRGFLVNNRVDRFLSRHMQRFSTPRVSTVVRASQIVLEKLLLLLGFGAICTGFVVYGGISRKWEAFSIAAHFVKGAIFFWYGLLTLGRWMGAFSEFGWAWNIRPQQPLVSRWKTRMPSAEFTESFVIWLYGASNVFLEHLNNAGGEWSPQDFEHVSITFLFFGGGMLGMLIDSAWIREMMSTSVVLQKSKDLQLADASRFDRPAAPADVADELWQEPKTYQLPLNPMPALVIMLLGIMMSAHQQKSMVSTMMHAQWGTLFFAFALARAATYVILYLKPPTSHFPARPPTELVAAFCLTSGGLMFMMSAHDTVWAIESNGLDAMTVFTVTMGLAGLIMAWQLICFAVKGWATRFERRAAGIPLA